MQWVVPLLPAIFCLVPSHPEWIHTPVQWPRAANVAKLILKRDNVRTGQKSDLYFFSSIFLSDSLYNVDNVCSRDPQNCFKVPVSLIFFFSVPLEIGHVPLFPQTPGRPSWTLFYVFNFLISGHMQLRFIGKENVASFFFGSPSYLTGKMVKQFPGSLVPLTKNILQEIGSRWFGVIYENSSPPQKRFRVLDNCLWKLGVIILSDLLTFISMYPAFLDPFVNPSSVREVLKAMIVSSSKMEAGRCFDIVQKEVPTKGKYVLRSFLSHVQQQSPGTGHTIFYAPFQSLRLWTRHLCQNKNVCTHLFFNLYHFLCCEKQLTLPMLIPDVWHFS